MTSCKGGTEYGKGFDKEKRLVTEVFQTDLKQIFDFIGYSKDKEKLRKHSRIYREILEIGQHTGHDGIVTDFNVMDELDIA